MKNLLPLRDGPDRGFCSVNSEPHTGIPDAETLQEWLREAVGCADIRKGCDTGHCGTCAVLVDGISVKSCSVLAREVHDRHVYTLSGLRGLDHLTVQAVLEATEQLRPFQCGYCISGFIIAAIDHLLDTPQPTEATVRDAFAGLLCRCTGYQGIVDMVLLAAHLQGAHSMDSHHRNAPDS